MLLPAAYRSLSRPSSPLRAQASPVRSYLTFSSRVSNCKSFFACHQGTLSTFDSKQQPLSRSLLFSLLYVSFPSMSKTSAACRRTSGPRGIPPRDGPSEKGNLMRQRRRFVVFLLLSFGSLERRCSLGTLASAFASAELSLPHPFLFSRKEVFQPHLPVRLPCYDLAPITRFTLGRSSRSRTSGTPDFHGLTGGVYKARERIHRAMADARLLANPTSRSRVADSDPN